MVSTLFKTLALIMLVILDTYDDKQLRIPNVYIDKKTNQKEITASNFSFYFDIVHH